MRKLVGPCAAILAALLFSGCVEQVDAPAGLASDKDCMPTMPPPIVLETMASGHNIIVNGGSSGGGRYDEFNWSEEPSRLAWLNVTVEWNAMTPLSERLGVSVDVYEDAAFFEQPHADGASPLMISVRKGEDTRLVDAPLIHLGTTRESQGLPVGASATVIDQPVTVTIQETYRCSDTVHP